MSDPALSTAEHRTRTVVLGGLASGLAAYAFTILGARVLGEVAYAPVGVLWTVQYLMITVALLSPEAYVTREGQVPRVILGWLVVTAVVLGLVAQWQGPMLFGSRSWAFTLATVLVAVGYSAFSLARGLSAHRGRLDEYAVMSGGESVVRLVVAGLLLLALATPEALGLTLPSGALVMTAWWWLRRRGVQAAGPPALPPPLVVVGTRRFLAATTTANAVAQLLLAGAPVLTALLGAAPALTSRVFVTVTAARAPLVLVYSGLLARLLGASRDMAPALLRRRLRQAVLVVSLTAALAVAVGAAVGPALVALAFGAGLRPSSSFAGLTGAAVVLTMGLLGANQVLIALGRAGRLVVPWLAGLLVASAVVLASDTSPDLRAGLASLAGLVATAVLLVPTVLAAARDHQPV